MEKPNGIQIVAVRTFYAGLLLYLNETDFRKRIDNLVIMRHSSIKQEYKPYTEDDDQSLPKFLEILENKDENAWSHLLQTLNNVGLTGGLYSKLAALRPENVELPPSINTET